MHRIPKSILPFDGEIHGSAGTMRGHSLDDFKFSQWTFTQSKKAPCLLMSRQEVLQGSGSFDIDVIATALFGPVAGCENRLAFSWLGCEIPHRRGSVNTMYFSYIESIATLRKRGSNKDASCIAVRGLSLRGIAVYRMLH